MPTVAFELFMVAREEQTRDPHTGEIRRSRSYVEEAGVPVVFFSKEAAKELMHKRRLPNLELSVAMQRQVDRDRVRAAADEWRRNRDACASNAERDALGPCPSLPAWHRPAPPYWYAIVSPLVFGEGTMEGPVDHADNRPLTVMSFPEACPDDVQIPRKQIRFASKPIPGSMHMDKCRRVESAQREIITLLVPALMLHLRNRGIDVESRREKGVSYRVDYRGPWPGEFLVTEWVRAHDDTSLRTAEYLIYSTELFDKFGTGALR